VSVVEKGLLDLRSISPWGSGEEVGKSNPVLPSTCRPSLADACGAVRPQGYGEGRSGGG